jgi:hypothetical protein
VAQTFDIRFARSAGLAAMLEVPENAFRWKGGGLLRIDAHGISIGLKRGLLALLGGKRTQRIPTENLRAVYREGDALRVEFQDGQTRRIVLPFWANDRDAAAQIVRLLPTSQTVEIEHSTDATHPGKPRADWRMLLSLAVMLVALVAGSWAIYQRGSLDKAVASAPVSDAESPEGSMPIPDASAALVEGPAVESVMPPATPAAQPAIPAATPEASPETAVDFLEPPPVVLSPPGSLPLPPDYVRSADSVIPIPRGTPAYPVAKRELAAFEQEAARLESLYRAQRNLLTGNALTPEDFAGQLDELEMRWWDLTFRLFDNEALADPALLDVRATMLAAARLWRGFLSTYANGIRKRDHVMIASAFDELARAQEMQSRARLFLR